MAAKDLMFKIAILDETKDSLTTIKNNLSGLQRYAQGVQQSVQSVVNSLSNIGKNVDIKLPNMDKFVEQINSLQSVMGKTDAFGVKSLKTALTDFDKVLKSMGDGSAMGNAMRKSVKSMLDAIPDMGTASESSLATFRDRYTRILGGITEEWKKVSTEINKNGGMNLFPKDNHAVLQEHVKSLQNAYKNLSAQSSDFLGAMNRAIAPTNFLQSIIDKVNELVQAIGNARNSLAGKGLLDPVVSKDNENIENISAKLKSLQEMLNTFGNGSYPNIMQGFLGAVSEAFDKVDRVVAERSQKALNMSVYTGGGSTEASEAHKANEQAIKGETEAQKSLNEQLKQTQQQLDAIKDKIAQEQTLRQIAASNIIRLRQQYGGGAGNLFLDWESNKNPKIAEAIEQDRKLQDQQVNEVTAKWNKFWEEQERMAQNFAKARGKALMDITTEDFQKSWNTDGRISKEMRAAMRVQYRDLMGLDFSSDGELGKYFNATKALKNSDAWQNEEYKTIDGLRKKLAEYNKELNAASSLSNSPNYDKAKAAVVKDEKLYNDAGWDLSTASYRRRQALKEEAELTQKLVELREKLNSTQQKATQPKQTEINFSEQAKSEAAKMVTPFEEVEKRINDIISRISSSVSTGLDTAFSKNLDSSALVTSLKGFIDNLNKLDESLQQMNKLAEVTTAAQTLLTYTKKNLESANKGGTTINQNGDEENANKPKFDYTTYINNINKIEAAVQRLQKAERDVSNARKTVSDGSKEAKDMDEWAANAKRMIDTLRGLEGNRSIIGQKGLMLTMDDANLDTLINQLQEIGREATLSKADLAALNTTIKELGSATPMGFSFQSMLAQAAQFKAAARDAAVASRLESANLSNEQKRKVLSDALGDITNNVNGGKYNLDIDNVLAKFDKLKDTTKDGIVSQSGIQDTIDKLRELKKRIDDLQGKPLTGTNSISALGAEYQQQTKIYRKRLSQLNQLASAEAKRDGRGMTDNQSIEIAGRKYEELSNKLAKYNQTYSAMVELQNKGLLSQDQITKLNAFKTAINELDNSLQHFNEIRQQKGTALGLDVNGNNARQIQDSKYILNASDASVMNKQFTKQVNDAKKPIKDLQSEADEAITKINRQLNQLQASAKNGVKVNADTSNLDASIEKLQKFKSELEEIRKAGGRLNGRTASDVINSTDFRQASAEANKFRTEIDGVVIANKNLANSENTVAQAIANSTNSARNQSQVLSDLKSMATQYLSVWGAQQFLSDMTNITGELELQERSLEVILGNASAAREMYSQIRDLSQMSPYTFEDLLKSHRQLAAFGIEAKDIFGTLKSLSDIGAGLDVDVSRLILAYGHTKSYGYLSGIQNRQFETAGIDLVGALTQHYNKLAEAEKRAGNSAQFVTRSDIFKRMRDRSIPFEDVQSVIMDLDKPGGKFYNMQIKQYDTLGGKLRNLRNNYRIMQSEIGQANHGILSGFVDMLNDVTENWQRFSRILKGVAFGYAAIKLAALAAGEGVLSANKRIFTMGLANGQQKAATNWLNQSHNALGMTPLGIGRGSRALWKTAFSGTSRNRLDVGDQEYLNVKNSKEINNLTKQRIALTGQLTTKAREDLLVEAGINKVRANQIANFGSWRRGIMSIRLGFIGAAQAAKAFIVSVATNPMTWIFAIIGGLTAISSKFSQMDELAETIGNNLADAAKTNIDGIKEILSEYDGLFTENQQPALTSRGTDGSKAELHYVNLDEAELEGRNLTELFNDLRKQLESQSPIYDKDYFNIMKAKDQKKQIEEEFNTLKRLQYVNEVVQQSSGNIEGALKSGSGIFRGEDFATNAGDYEKQYQALKNSFTLDDATWSRLTSDQQKHIRQYMRALGTTRQDAAAMYMKNNPNDERMQQALGASNSNWIWNLSAYKNDVGADTKDVKALGNTIANTIMASFVDAKGNLDAQGAEEYFGQIVNQIMADAKVGTPEIIAELSDNIVEATVAALRGQGKVKQADEFEAAHWENTIGAVVNSQLGNSVTRGMSTKDAYKMADKTIHDIINRFMVQSPDFKKWWKRIANTAQGADVRKYWEDSAKHLADSALNAASWQLRMKRKYHLSINFDTDVDYSDYIAKLRKAYKEAVEKVNSLSKNRIKWALHIDVLPDLNFKDTKAIKSFRNLIMAQSKIDAAKNKALLKKYGTLNMFKYSAEDRKAAEDANERLEMDKYLMKIVNEEMLPNANALEGEHLQFTDPNKDKKSRKKSNGEDKADREEERRLSARLKLIQDAYNMYKDYYDLYGKDRALREVRRNFKDLRPSDFANLSSLDGLISLYNDFINEVKDTKWKRPKEMKDRANNLISEAITDRQRAELNRDKDAMDKWASNESLWLDRLTKQWDLYDKVRKATGNRDLAVRLSGFNGEEFTNQADALKNHIASEITSFNLKGADGAALGINFSDVLGMSDEQIEDKVKNLFGNNEKYSVQIKAIVADLKKWRDLQQQILDESADSYASAIGKMQDYDSVVARNNMAAKTANDSIDQNKKLTDEEKKQAKDVNNQEALTKNLQASIGYINLINRTLAMGNADYVIQLAKAEKDLGDRLKNNTISASEYASEMRKLDDLQQKRNENNFFGKNTAFGSLIQRGIPGLAQYYKDNIDYRRSELADKHYSQEQIENDPQIKKWQKQLDKINKLINNFGDLDAVVGAVIGVFNGLQQAATDLSNMFDALGNEHMANFFSDFSDVVGGIGSIFTPVDNLLKNAMSGNVSGVISSAISAPVSMITGPITAFAKLHDKKRQRAIDKLSDDVSKIEGYTETIAKAQERTLGYDYGDVIRDYQKQYAANQASIRTIWGKALTYNKEGAAGTAMAQYYGAAGADTDISGYQQQYNMLIAKRKDYINMYNHENDKKKKNKQSLEEYKEKIADLDDQIKYFGQDLAKNLWSIDIKSWADQISDGLVTAFENGEDAGKAFKDSVRSIMQSVVGNIMKLSIIEPMFKPLQDSLNSLMTNGMKKGTSINDLGRQASALASDFLSQNANAIITASTEFLNGAELGLNNAGLTLLNDSSSTLSSGISSASEDSVNALTGQLAAMRQDVSVIRLQDTMFYNEAWPDYVKNMTSGVSYLQKIDSNVLAIRNLMSENGALYEQVRTLRDDLHSIVTQQKHIKID